MIFCYAIIKTSNCNANCRKHLIYSEMKRNYFFEDVRIRTKSVRLRTLQNSFYT
jgi:hypothetical protein